MRMNNQDVGVRNQRNQPLIQKNRSQNRLKILSSFAFYSMTRTGFNAGASRAAFLDRVGTQKRDVTKIWVGLWKRLHEGDPDYGTGDSACKEWQKLCGSQPPDQAH